MVDAELVDGSLTSGELTLEGARETEFLLSTYVCHPALANDNLSGIVVLWALARTLARQRLEHTYRLLWSPGTLGPLCWLARNLDTLDRVQNGLVISCVGDPGPLRYKRSRRGDAPVDRAAAYVLGASRTASSATGSRPAATSGSTARPGSTCPVGTLSRTPHGLFPEYHSSADDLTLVQPEALAASYRAALEIIDVVETNASFRNLSPYGEPQLGRRGLYQSVPDGTNPELAYLWLLNLSDGRHDLLAIAERSGLPFDAVREAAATLERARPPRAPGLRAWTSLSSPARAAGSGAPRRSRSPRTASASGSSPARRQGCARRASSWRNAAAPRSTSSPT